MKAILIFTIGILALSSTLALTNLKEKAVGLPKDTDLFQEAIDEHHEKVARLMSHHEKLQTESLKKLLKASKYACTGGRSPSSLSRKEYIKAFNNGPCAPTAWLAGISGTKLIVTVDCKTFRSNHKTDFEKCWSSCSGSYAPKSEYRIWVPFIGSEMSILHPSQNKKDCFTNLIGWDLEKLKKDGSTEYRKGLRIYPMGLSPKTKKKSESDCGLDAISDLLPTKFQISGFGQYKDVANVFKAAGYKSGITL